jgi:hypothetical protein
MVCRKGGGEGVCAGMGVRRDGLDGRAALVATSCDEPYETLVLDPLVACSYETAPKRRNVVACLLVICRSTQFCAMSPPPCPSLPAAATGWKEQPSKLSGSILVVCRGARSGIDDAALPVGSIEVNSEGACAQLRTPPLLEREHKQQGGWNIGVVAWRRGQLRLCRGRKTTGAIFWYTPPSL